MTALDRLLTLADSLGMVVVIRKYGTVTANACGGVNVFSGYRIGLQPDAGVHTNGRLCVHVTELDLEKVAVRLIEDVAHLAAVSVQKESP